MDTFEEEEPIDIDVVQKEIIQKLSGNLEDIVRTTEDENVEFWFARELMLLLGYDRWENFSKVIEKAKTSCTNAGGVIENQFRDVTKMVELGSGAQRPIQDIMLTRYACYLIAQNGDARKDEIAFAQTYFAVQTLKQEVFEDHIRLQESLSARQKLTESESELSKNIYKRGVDEKGFGIIRSKGDAALFGGNKTLDMKNKLDVPKSALGVISVF